MRCSKFCIYLLLGLAAFAPRSFVVAQENEFEEELFLEEGETAPPPSNDELGSDEADFELDEEVNFDDFKEEKKPEKKKVQQEPPPNPDGIELDPLEEIEEKPTEVPIAPTPVPTPPAPVPVPEPPAEPEPMAPPPAPAPTPRYAEPIVEQDLGPDLNYEARLHDIYLNYHASRTSPEQWTALVGDRESEVYQINRGDTLWGISKTFFNDGNYWPKIWSINANIRNPHLIEPGNSIRFLLGTEAEPPAFTVTEAGKEQTPTVSEEPEPEPVATPELAKPQEVRTETGETVEIPPPLTNYTPVLKKVPPSFPHWQSGSGRSKYDDMGINYGRRPIRDVNKELLLQSYVADQPVSVTGEIVETEAGGEVATEMQYVYVSLPQGQGRSGERWLVLRNQGPIKSVHPSIDKTGLGQRVDLLGEVVLRDPVLGKISKDQEMWRAEVSKAIDPIQKGSGVTRGELIRYRMDEIDGQASNVVAQIIGGPYDNQRMVFTVQSVVFLNRGSQDGLTEGQILPIRRNLSLRNPQTKVEENMVSIGQLRILKVGDHVATALVTQASDAIFSGDITGQGSYLGRTTQLNDSDVEEEFLNDDSLIETPSDSPSSTVPGSEENEFEDPELEL